MFQQITSLEKKVCSTKKWRRIAKIHRLNSYAEKLRKNIALKDFESSRIILQTRINVIVEGMSHYLANSMKQYRFINQRQCSVLPCETSVVLSRPISIKLQLTSRLRHSLKLHPTTTKRNVAGFHEKKRSAVATLKAPWVISHLSWPNDDVCFIGRHRARTRSLPTQLTRSRDNDKSSRFFSAFVERVPRIKKITSEEAQNVANKRTREQKSLCNETVPPGWNPLESNRRVSPIMKSTRIRFVNRAPCSWHEQSD